MGPWEIVVIIACVLVVGGVIVGSIVRKKKAKASGCSSGCVGCPYCNSCGKAQETTKEE